MNPKQMRDTIAAQCGFNKAQWQKHHDDSWNWLSPAIDKAQQGEPTSFSEYLERNNDSIEMPLDRTEATAQWFDDKERDCE